MQSAVMLSQASRRKAELSPLLHMGLLNHSRVKTKRPCYYHSALPLRAQWGATTPHMNHAYFTALLLARPCEEHLKQVVQLFMS